MAPAAGSRPSRGCARRLDHRGLAGVRTRIRRSARSSASATTTAVSGEYWAQRRTGASRFRNCGVFGERTDEIALAPDACATGAQVLVVQGGINDIARGRSVYVAAATLRAMVRRGDASACASS